MVDYIKEYKHMFSSPLPLYKWTKDMAAQRGFDVKDEVDKLTVSPIVDQGRWIILCPFCAGAEMADSDDPRFFCLSCGNAKVDGAWLKVEWPKQRQAIEAVCLTETDVSKQNWKPEK